jgi:uncharacterized protein (TIGR03437 family)
MMALAVHFSSRAPADEAVPEVPVAAASTGIFAIHNADGSVNSAANSADAGTELIIYATG